MIVLISNLNHILLLVWQILQKTKKKSSVIGVKGNKYYVLLLSLYTFPILNEKKKGSHESHLLLYQFYTDLTLTEETCFEK